MEYNTKQNRIIQSQNRIIQNQNRIIQTQNSTIKYLQNKLKYLEINWTTEWKPEELENKDWYTNTDTNNVTWSVFCE